MGALITSFGIKNFKKAKASANWPRVAGKIVASSIKKDDADGEIYRAEILYEYPMENIVWKGRRVSYGWKGTSNPSYAKKIVARYPVGKTVAVYYKPGDPMECVLEPGVNDEARHILIAGVILVVFGCLMAVYLLLARMKF